MAFFSKVSQWYSWNIFKTYAVGEFPDVSMPLEQTRRSASIDSYRSRLSGRTHTSISSARAIEDGDSPFSSRRTSRGKSELELLRDEVDFETALSGQNSVYERKLQLINLALNDIGIGPYQWLLALHCIAGWTCDALFLQGIALTLPQLTPEFGTSVTDTRWATSGFEGGLGFGSIIWGRLSDAHGRRLPFKLALVLTVLGSVGIGIAPSFAGVCGCFALAGFGIGGNMAVDTALLYEVLPRGSTWWLNLLPEGWTIGYLIASGVGWALNQRSSCSIGHTLPSCLVSGPPCCSSDDNKGWRYLAFVLAGLTLLMQLSRSFFQVVETPQHWLALGHDAKAVAAIHRIAYNNSTRTWLSEAILSEVGDPITDRQAPCFRAKGPGRFVAAHKADLRLCITTGLLCMAQLAIGLAYPIFNLYLPQYLANPGDGQTRPSAYESYTTTVLTAGLCVLGPPIALAADRFLPIDTKYSLSGLSTITGVFVVSFSLAKGSETQRWLCVMVGVFETALYGLLYTHIARLYPASIRGTSIGLASGFNRVAGIVATVAAKYAGDAGPLVPLHISAAAFGAAALTQLFFPAQTHSRARR